MLSSCIAYLLNKATTDVQVERLVELTRSLYDHKFFGYALALSLQYDSIENVVQSESPSMRLTLWKNVQTLLKYANLLTYLCIIVLLCSKPSWCSFVGTRIASEVRPSL